MDHLSPGLTALRLVHSEMCDMWDVWSSHIPYKVGVADHFAVLQDPRVGATVV
jgi:hypothetical protein